MKQHTMIPAPLTLRPLVLQGGRHLIRASSPHGRCLVAYDPVTMAGGVYHETGEIWAVYAPIRLQEFIGSLSWRQIQIAEGEDLQTWLDAVAELMGATRQ